MKNKKDNVSKIVQDFQALVKHKPSMEEMFFEVRMMKFKIRPLSGDILSVDLNDRKFIEVLWNLGKLDQFFQKKYPGLTRREKEIFVRIFDDLYAKYQTELNQIRLIRKNISKKSQILEMEIFKEKTNVN